ncbi:MAG: futalosine hydrolase [Bacteroidota bacterium]|jgi:futalosine hydrolase
MHILFIAATLFESELLIQQYPFAKNENCYTAKVNNHRIDLLLTGVGIVNTTYFLQQYLITNKPEMVIQYGIAGVHPHFCALGNCFAITHEIFADIGVFENGNYKNLEELNLSSSNISLVNHSVLQLLIPEIKTAKARTVSLIESDSIRLLILNKKYNVDVESMEGAAFHFVMAHTKIPYLQIRAASNFIGERDKTNWEMKLAVDNINELVLKIIDETILK